MDPPPRKPYQLQADSVWFITGCSSGIGQALAELVHARGHRLVATARQLSSLSYLPDDDPKVLKIQLDVASQPSIDSTIEAVLARFGRLDVVVNNAGYTLYGDAENADVAEARLVMETIFWGTMRIMQLATRIMREENARDGGQQGGVIMNTTSMGGRVGFPGNAAYHAAKFAVEGFTESMAKEVRPDWNINYCLIEPGGVKTKYVANAKLIESHQAYDRDDMPTRILSKYIEDPATQENWASPVAIAGAMYEIIDRKKSIPLRHPLGPDAWETLSAELPKYAKNFEETKELAYRVGNQAQADSLAALNIKV